MRLFGTSTDSYIIFDWLKFNYILAYFTQMLIFSTLDFAANFECSKSISNIKKTCKNSLIKTKLCYIGCWKHYENLSSISEKTCVNLIGFKAMKKLEPLSNRCIFLTTCISRVRTDFPFYIQSFLNMLESSRGCLYVCLCVCMCVSALQPKQQIRFWWKVIKNTL